MITRIKNIIDNQKREIKYFEEEKCHFAEKLSSTENTLKALHVELAEWQELLGKCK